MRRVAPTLRNFISVIRHTRSLAGLFVLLTLVLAESSRAQFAISTQCDDTTDVVFAPVLLGGYLDTTLTLYNRDTLDVSYRLQLSGSVFRRIAPQSDSLVVPANDSTQLRIRFEPKDTLNEIVYAELVNFPKCQQGQWPAIRFSGMGLLPTRENSVFDLADRTPAPIALIRDLDADVRIQFMHSGRDSLRIDSLYLERGADFSFRLDSNFLPPFVIRNGESFTGIMSITRSGKGFAVDSLRIKHDDPIASAIAIPVQGIVESTISVNRSSASPDLFIFPNPSTGRFTIRTPNWSKSMLIVLDLLGREVERLSFVRGHQFDLKLHPGLYTLRIEGLNSGGTQVEYRQIVIE